MLLFKIIDLYTYVVLASVLVSWLQLPPSHPIIRFLDTMVEPVLKPIRQVLPATGGLDFSPMVLIVLLQVLKRALF